MEAFENWCLEAGAQPLPASPETVAAFVTSETPRRSAATLKRRLAAIRKIHRLLRLENPIPDEDVVIAMRRALRSTCARRQRALGLTEDLRERLIAACPQTLAGQRDRALIALGYDTLCRRAELVGLRVEDIKPSASGAAQILVRRAKNDPYGAGRLAYISLKTLNIVRTWLRAANIESGFIFRAAVGKRVGRNGLHAYSVTRILKRAAKGASLPPEQVALLSGHSMRVGAAQDLISSGLSVLPIMQAGGWRTTNVVAR